MAAGIVIRDWRPMHRGSLLGFARVELPSGMILVDVLVMSGERGPWATPPSKPMVGRDGTVMTDNAGKARYTAVVEFSDKAIRDRFSAAVVEAMRAAHPDVFGSGDGR